MDLSFMPAINASLNGLACVCLIAGFVLVKQGRITGHRRCMLGASVLSGLFLVCYTIHYVWRFSQEGGLHTKYHGGDVARIFYYTVLLTHIPLAMTVPFWAVWLIRLGMTGRIDKHRRVAKFGYPIWMYVSVTGVIIYLMLYWFNPLP